MSRRNLWYDCMFITMRIVVLILPVLVCDDILTVRIFMINQNLRFFLCYDESGPGYLCVLSVIHRVVQLEELCLEGV